MKVQTLVLLAIVAAMCFTARAQEQVYCGRRLAMAWALLCDDQEQIQKRSNSIELDYGWPWVAPRHARAMGRGKRDIVMECCEKPCSVNELMNYC